MAKHINKNALITELDRLEKVQPVSEIQPNDQNKIDWLAGKSFTINSLEVFIDTLEVKEVDSLTDIVIEKAKKWFEKSEHFDFNGIRRYGNDEFEDFENYMRGGE